jgi:glucan phosphorylase
MITKLVKRLFEDNKQREKRLMEEWLADSASLQDIERKQKMISRGEAPWQVQANHNLRGWI